MLIHVPAILCTTTTADYRYYSMADAGRISIGRQRLFTARLAADPRTETPSQEPIKPIIGSIHVHVQAKYRHGTEGSVLATSGDRNRQHYAPGVVVVVLVWCVVGVSGRINNRDGNKEYSHKCDLVRTLDLTRLYSCRLYGVGTVQTDDFCR